MAKYSVTKYFGHFSQCWHVQANSEKEAWDMAEKNGSLFIQNVYRKPFPEEYEGFVQNLDEKQKSDPPLSKEQYYQWMKESVDMGMVITKFERKSIDEIVKGE